ncbi:MAG TPA: MFS transporter [Candidatus Desulfovibrio gallistercoris]|nr:MFS transporter [Candidatus Desulfovibrio gallistercoris]
MRDDGSRQRSLAALSLLCFALADVRDGLGPFFGVYLQSHGWGPDAIGYVMTLGGLMGVVAASPLGALVDASHDKRRLLTVVVLGIVLAAVAVFLSPLPLVAGASQITQGLLAAAVAPLISALSLGLVGQAGLSARLGRNEAWNHAGNAASAVLGGAVGWFYGIGGVLLVMAGMGLLSLLAVRGIQPQHIDYAAARGLETAERTQAAGPAPSRLSLLFGDKALLCTGGIMLFFHLGNAAMLPLLGQSAVAHFDVDPAVYTACTVLVAQGTMILTALWAAWIAPRRGYGPALFCALIALPVRGLVAGFWQSPWNIVPVQILDGVGAGIMGVVTPGMVALLLRGSGHINLGLGMVMTLQGIGAAFSATWGGVVADLYGYSMAFLALAVAPCVALLLLLAGIRFLPRLRDALSRQESRQIGRYKAEVR